MITFFTIEVALSIPMINTIKIDVEIQKGSLGAKIKVYSAKTSPPVNISCADFDFTKIVAQSMKSRRLFPMLCCRTVRCRSNMPVKSNKIANTIGIIPGEAYRGPPTSAAIR